MMSGERSARRRRAYRRGLRAEWVAAWLLRLKGFRILAARHRTPAGEIDLVARRGRLLVFAEVKARDDEKAGHDAVTSRSRERIARAAAIYVSRNAALRDLEQRFDLVVIAPGRLPVHLPNAFSTGRD